MVFHADKNEKEQQENEDKGKLRGLPIDSQFDSSKDKQSNIDDEHKETVITFSASIAG